MESEKSQISWHKSSYSNGGPDCVETSVSLLPEGKVPVRDSKRPADPHLVFSTDAFAAFIGDVKTGVYDV